MRRSIAFFAVATLVSTSSLAAQGCMPSARPYFEFQVNVTAKFIGDSTARPRPTANLNAEIIVQFVVDSLGRPDSATFKVLRAPSQAAGDSARAALPLWRFTPARVGACRVPLLFQTSVQR